MEEETHEFSQFVLKEKKPSRFVPRATLTVEVGISCPRCAERLPMLEHGGKQKCVKCNLNMQVFGNGITLWEGW